MVHIYKWLNPIVYLTFLLPWCAKLYFVWCWVAQRKTKGGDIFACDVNSTHHFTLMSMFLIHRDCLKQDSCFIIIRSHVSMHLDGTHLGERLSF